MAGAFKEHVLGAHVVVAQHLAVVSGEDDNRVVEKAKFAQAREEVSQIVVNLRDAGVVGAPDVADQSRCELVRAVEKPC